MAKLELMNVSKSFGKSEIINNLNLTVNDGEIIVILGPSGCGKSTTLRMIAGLESISAGDILLDNESIVDIPANKRQVAMVFQSSALFPYMDVYHNLSYGLGTTGMSNEEIDSKIHEVASLLGVEELLERKPNTLSGGQKQRISIGRALMRDAKIYLFDEPLSSLDSKLRLQLRDEIIRLHKELKTTMIYVTHDQSEAMSMADRIIVMKDGKIEQSGTPDDIYNHPATKFVADFIGTPSMNFIDGNISYKVFQSNDGTISIGFPNLNLINIDVSVGIRPEDLHVDYMLPQIPFHLEYQELVGGEYLLHSKNLVAKSSVSLESLESIGIDTKKIHLFSKEGKRI